MEILIIGLLVLLYFKIDIDKAEIKKSIKDNQDVIFTKLSMNKIEYNEKLNKLSSEIRLTGKDMDKKIEREIYKLAFTPIEIRTSRKNETLMREKIQKDIVRER